jgi:predicted nuclease with TOPRIM domain
MDMQAEKSLKEALERFERRLETPLVPGELTGWICEAVEACHNVGPTLDRQRRRTHEQILDAIAREDAELIPRAEELRKEDEELQCDYRRLREEADRLAEQAETAEPHERRLDERRASFVRHGLDFVIRTRTQELAVETWFLEAFDRDRGVVD